MTYGEREIIMLLSIFGELADRPVNAPAGRYDVVNVVETTCHGHQGALYGMAPAQIGVITIGEPEYPDTKPLAEGWDWDDVDKCDDSLWHYYRNGQSLCGRHKQVDNGTTEPDVYKNPKCPDCKRILEGR